MGDSIGMGLVRFNELKFLRTVEEKVDVYFLRFGLVLLFFGF